MTGFRTIAGGRSPATCFLPISKIDKEQQLVYGYASTEAVDSEQEIVKKEAIAAALDGYMQFANIREMHQLSAVGVCKSAEMDDKGLYISAKVVDPTAWDKVKEGVYKGFSIGGKATARDPQNSRVITGLDLIEISLVDRPANPEALIEVFKADSIPQPSRTAKQTWDCGMLGHEHESEGDANKCILEQDEKLGKGDAHVKMRKALADEINKLDGSGLRKALAGVERASGSDADGDGGVPDAAEEKKTTKAADAKEDEAVDQSLAIQLAARILQTDLSQVEDWAGLCKAVGGNEATVRVALVKAVENYTNIKSAIPPALVGLISRLGKAKVPTKKQSTVVVEHQEIDVEKLLSTDEFAVLLKKDNKDKPEGDYGSHADAGYADPGYQEDKKPRYPLKKDGKLSEERIRAAWNYINKEKNQKPYTASQVKSIKNRIIAAWKSKIDPDGPPSAKEDSKSKALKLSKESDDVNKALSALGGPDAKGNLKKGLLTVASAIGLLEKLNLLHDMLKAEAAREGDNSPAPARLEGIVESFADLLKALLEEEVTEMLENREATDFEIVYDMPAPVYFASTASKMAGAGLKTKRMADVITKAIGDKTGSPGFELLSSFAELLSKATAAQTQEWGAHGEAEQQENDKWEKSSIVKRAQHIHDVACAMGASCAKAKKKDEEDDKEDADDEEDEKEKAKKSKKSDKEEAEKEGKKRKDPPPPKKKPDHEDDEEDEEDEEDEKEDVDADGDDDGDEEKPKKKKKTKKAAAVDVGLTALAPVLVEMLTELKSMRQENLDLRRDPPKPKGTLRAVGKGEDIISHDTVKLPDPAQDPEGYKKAVLNQILANPNFVRP